MPNLSRSTMNAEVDPICGCSRLSFRPTGHYGPLEDTADLGLHSDKATAPRTEGPLLTSEPEAAGFRGIRSLRRASVCDEGQEFPLSFRPVDGLFVAAVRGRRGATCSISCRRGPDHKAGGASIVKAKA
jgi:hypothetical protein